MNNRGLIATKDNNSKKENPKTSNKTNKIKSGKRIFLKDEYQNDEDILVPDLIKYKENINGSKNFINKASHNDSE